MKIKMMFVVLILTGLGIYAQDIRVEVSPGLVKCLPGVPVDIVINVTNAGKEDIWIAAESLSEGIRIKKNSYAGDNGETMNCYYPSPITVKIVPPTDCDGPIKDVIRFKAGETIKMYELVCPGCHCPVSRDLTGLWKGEIEVTMPIAEGVTISGIKKTVIVKEYMVEIQKLEEDDLAYLNAAKVWPNKPDPKVYYKGDYFYWKELFRPNIIPKEEIERMLNQEYAGSTYAGYQMLRHSPGDSLKYASKIDEIKFDMHINNNNKLFSAAEKEERRKAAKLRYSDFVNKARSFLVTHSDFPQEDLMRNAIAVALFYTDKPQEAWMEVETLAMMEGRFADDAKALLAERCQPPSPKKNPPID